MVEVKKQSTEKKSLRSLADKLREKFTEEELSDDKEVREKLREKLRAIKQDLSDEEVEDISNKITKDDVEKEAKELKENVDGKSETLIPLEDYIKCAVHLGTKVITPHMRKYVYKRRADGLAVINTALIDKKIREAVEFMLNYEPNQIYLACKREAGWEPAKKFEQATNIKTFTKKYPPGVTTNLILDNFFEAELTIICDPWIDRNPLNDTAKLKKPVMALCDTNNFITNVTQIIPCNNKSKKSIGCVLYLLAREYCRAKKLPFDYNLEDFSGELE